MGVGFRLNLKCALSLQPRFSSFPSTSYSPFKRKGINYDTARVSLPSSISMESDTSLNDRMSTNASSSTSLFLDDGYSETEDIKRSVGKRLCGSIEDDRLTFLTSLQADTMSRYNLMLENLVILEDTFSDSDVVTLERDILVHIETLGASKLFHASLSKTPESPSFDAINEASIKPIVPSTKKEERKLRRERASKRAYNISMVKFPSKGINHKSSRVSTFSLRNALKSKGGRVKIAKNEAELSRGVKLVGDLERLKGTLEEEKGGVVSFSSWAAAAGVDKKVLLENLHFGWCCRDQILKSTRPLVLYLARNYSGLGIAFDDLIQAGNFGVLQGAERFDASRGYKFSTYVQYWIRKSMSMLMSRHARGIRVPLTLSKAINQIKKARKALQTSHGKHPDDHTIAKFTGLSLAKIASADKCPRVVGSIDDKIGHGIDVRFRECMPDATVEIPEETVVKQAMIREIWRGMKSLEGREAKVLALRFGLGGYQQKSLDEIGKVFGVSKEWIRKIEKGALTKLKLKHQHILQTYLQLLS